MKMRIEEGSTILEILTDLMPGGTSQGALAEAIWITSLLSRHMWRIGSTADFYLEWREAVYETFAISFQYRPFLQPLEVQSATVMLSRQQAERRIEAFCHPQEDSPQPYSEDDENDAPRIPLSPVVMLEDPRDRGQPTIFFADELVDQSASANSSLASSSITDLDYIPALTTDENGLVPLPEWLQKKAPKEQCAEISSLATPSGNVICTSTPMNSEHGENWSLEQTPGTRRAGTPLIEPQTDTDATPDSTSTPVSTE